MRVVEIERLRREAREGCPQAFSYLERLLIRRGLLSPIGEPSAPLEKTPVIIRKWRRAKTGRDGLIALFPTRLWSLSGEIECREDFGHVYGMTPKQASDPDRTQSVSFAESQHFLRELEASYGPLQQYSKNIRKFAEVRTETVRARRNVILYGN